VSRPDPGLPEGFVVRLHDDVELGTQLVAGSRVLKLSVTARRLIVDRAVTVESPVSGTFVDRLLDLDLADPDLAAVAGRLDDVTVVVPVRDNHAGVDRLLEGLATRVTCIVVDDASAEPRELAQVVARHRAQLVRLDHNMGPAAARTIGLRHVATPFVAFIDSDVLVSAGSLSDLTRHFADGRLVAVAPRIRTTPGGTWYQRYEAACGSLDLGPRSATVRPWSPVTYVPSACLVARVRGLGAGFDPTMRTGEDVDLIWRLQAEGHRVRYAAEIEARHDPRSSIAAWLGRKAFYGSSAARLAVRHGDRVAPAVLTAPVATVALGVLLQRRWSLGVAAVAGVGFVRSTGSAVPDLSPRRRASLTMATSAAMARQVSSLVLRHWWPVSLGLALISSRARRAVAVVAVIDGAVAHRASKAQLDPVRFMLARRCDDLAYGAGLWWGAARQRSVACLIPHWVSSRRGRVER